MCNACYLVLNGCWFICTIIKIKCSIVITKWNIVLWLLIEFNYYITIRKTILTGTSSFDKKLSCWLSNTSACLASRRNTWQKQYSNLKPLYNSTHFYLKLYVPNFYGELQQNMNCMITLFSTHHFSFHYMYFYINIHKTQSCKFNIRWVCTLQEQEQWLHLANVH